MAWRCWFGRHDLLLTLLRDAHGVLVQPVTIVWRCARCGRACGCSTYLVPRPL
jgi:hypothetical protein